MIALSANKGLCLRSSLAIDQICVQATAGSVVSVEITRRPDIRDANFKAPALRDGLMFDPGAVSFALMVGWLMLFGG